MPTTILNPDVMTRLRIVLVSALFLSLPPLVLLAQQGGYPRTMYVSFDRTPIYAGADYHSEVIDTLRLHDSVGVIGTRGKYFQVSMGGKTGFILWSNLAENLPKGKGKGGKAVKAQAVEPVPSAKAPPSAAVAAPEQKQREVKTKGTAARSQSESDLPQCKAITKSGKQCSRRAADTSGYCWQHKPGR
jgi:hypothetical protein